MISKSMMMVFLGCFLTFAFEAVCQRVDNPTLTDLDAQAFLVRHGFSNLNILALPVKDGVRCGESLTYSSMTSGSSRGPGGLLHTSGGYAPLGAFTLYCKDSWHSSGRDFLIVARLKTLTDPELVMQNRSPVTATIAYAVRRGVGLFPETFTNASNAGVTDQIFLDNCPPILPMPSGAVDFRACRYKAGAFPHEIAVASYPHPSDPTSYIEVLYKDAGVARYGREGPPPGVVAEELSRMLTR
jgi:hypothetical protein